MSITGWATRRLSYDSEGRLSQVGQTFTGREELSAVALTIIWDSLDRLKESAYPQQYGAGDIRKKVEPAYDIASRMDSLKFGGVTYASNPVYNASSQTTSLNVGGQIAENYGYDPKTGLMTDQQVRRGAELLVDLKYNYTLNNDPNNNGAKTGQLTGITDLKNQARNRAYEYDKLGRLSKVKGGVNAFNNPTWYQSYSYDRYGNRSLVQHTDLGMAPVKPGSQSRSDLIGKIGPAAGGAANRIFSADNPFAALGINEGYGSITADSSDSDNAGTLLRGGPRVTAEEYGNAPSANGIGGALLAKHPAGAAPPQVTTFSIWAPATTPANPLDNDGSAVELGLKFRSDIDGYISGVRFYKGGAANGGAHLGHLWNSAGTLLGSVAFTNESTSGWQQALFETPIQITANTTYVVSYFAPQGHFSYDSNYFASSGVDNAPLHALSNALAGGNGVYRYGPTGGFPADTFQATNYWVDVVFTTTPPGPDTTPPTVTSFSPAAGAANVNADANVTVTFSEAMNAASVNGSTVELRDPSNALVSATVSYNAASLTATLDPTATLAAGVTYTARVRGGGTDPRVKDVAGNALAADVTWTFTTAALPTCPCSIWGSGATPAAPADPESAELELGVKFQSDVSGWVTKLRFYKGATNTGTHIGSLWTSSGTLLASATYSGETASGWQEVTLATPVAIAANTTYVASYHTTVGHYAVDNGYFATSGVNNPPLRAPATGAVGGNGVFKYGPIGFPAETFNGNNYWVDVVFTTAPPDTTPPTVASFSPAAGATNVSPTANVTVTFSEAMDAATLNGSTVELRDPSNALVSATVSYDAASLTATLDPTASLAPGVTYTARVRGGGTDPRVKDVAGNALDADVTWTFTTTLSGSIPLDGLANLSYNASNNRINTPGFEYDPAGNQTRAVINASGTQQQYRYDCAGRLAQVLDASGNVLATYAYGAGNQRLMSVEGGVTKYFAWDGGKIIAEYEAWGANGLIWKTSYVYLGGQLLATTSGADGTETRFHHPDRLGTRLTTDAGGTVVSEQLSLPFGTMQPFTSIYGGANPYQHPTLGNPSKKRFTSYDRSDATGLDYAVNRFYSPQQGRFTQVDPIGMGAAELANPQSLNLYAYVENDPINSTDPLGLDGPTQVLSFFPFPFPTGGGGGAGGGLRLGPFSFSFSFGGGSFFNFGAQDPKDGIENCNCTFEIKTSAPLPPPAPPVQEPGFFSRIWDGLKGFGRQIKRDFTSTFRRHYNNPSRLLEDLDFTASAMGFGGIGGTIKGTRKGLAKGATLIDDAIEESNVILYHGTSVASAETLLAGEGLNAARAAALKIDGPVGFFLATHADDAAYFATRRGTGAILEYHISPSAAEALGLTVTPLGGLGKFGRFLGGEVVIPVSSFEKFNTLRAGGGIIVVPR